MGIISQWSYFSKPQQPAWATYYLWPCPCFQCPPSAFSMPFVVLPSLSYQSYQIAIIHMVSEYPRWQISWKQKSLFFSFFIACWFFWSPWFVFVYFRYILEGFKEIYTPLPPNNHLLSYFSAYSGKHWKWGGEIGSTWCWIFSSVSSGETKNNIKILVHFLTQFRCHHLWDPVKNT